MGEGRRRIRRPWRAVSVCAYADLPSMNQGRCLLSFKGHMAIIYDIVFPGQFGNHGFFRRFLTGEFKADVFRFVKDGQRSVSSVLPGKYLFQHDDRLTRQNNNTREDHFYVQPDSPQIDEFFASMFRQRRGVVKGFRTGCCS